MKTNEVFNCAGLLPFPPGAVWKTQLPRLRAAERWASRSTSCCHLGRWELPLLDTPTDPWPYSPNLNYSEPWHPAKRRNHPGIYSPWRIFFFLNAPDCYCLRCNWACKNIKAQTAWHVMKWERQRAERKRRLTQHLKGKMRRRKGEEIKQQSKRT